MISHPRRVFLVGCLVEVGLLGLALAGSWLFGVDLFKTVQWSAFDAVIGMLAAVPLLGLFFRVLQAQSGPLGELRVFLDNVVRPAFGSLTILELATISVLAGLAEESLFRGLIQGGLADQIGQIPALLLAGVIFGLCHAVNRPYAVVASVIGIYLGVFFAATGNLLVPILTHGIYDFAALVYFLRIRRNRAGGESCMG